MRTSSSGHFIVASVKIGWPLTLIASRFASGNVAQASWTGVAETRSPPGSIGRPGPIASVEKISGLATLAPTAADSGPRSARRATTPVFVAS